MSRILVVGASERSMTNAVFVPFRGIGYKLKGRYEAPSEVVGTPETTTPLHPVPNIKLDSLFSQLRAATTAMEAATSAVMTLQKKNEVHEREIWDLKEKVSLLTHQPPKQQYNPYTTTAADTLPLPHCNDTDDETSAIDSLYSCQEEIASISMINSDEIPNQIWSNNRIPCKEHPNYSSDNLRAQH